MDCNSIHTSSSVLQQSNKSITTIADLSQKHLFDELNSLQEHEDHQDLRIKQLEQCLQLKKHHRVSSTPTTEDIFCN